MVPLASLGAVLFFQKVQFTPFVKISSKMITIRTRPSVCIAPVVSEVDKLQITTSTKKSSREVGSNSVFHVCVLERARPLLYKLPLVGAMLFGGSDPGELCGPAHADTIHAKKHMRTYV